MIYLAIELVSIPSYVLAGMIRNDKESNEASLKYVIFGSFASGLMLFGLSMIYGITGSTSIGGVSAALQSIEYTSTIYFPMILILAGFGYKISMVPFHYWTPDVYEGAPTPVTAFLSVAPKAAGFAILIRVFHSMYTTDGSISTVGVFSGIDWPMMIAVASAAFKKFDFKDNCIYHNCVCYYFRLIYLSQIFTQHLMLLQSCASH